MITETPSCVLSQYLWYNANTQVDKTSILFSRFSEKNIHYVSQLFNNNGPIKKLHEFKREYDLHDNYYFQWVQLAESIPEKWKFIIKKTVKLQIILSFMSSFIERLKSYNFRKTNINRNIFYIDFKSLK